MGNWPPYYALVYSVITEFGSDSYIVADDRAFLRLMYVGKRVKESSLVIMACDAPHLSIVI